MSWRDRVWKITAVELLERYSAGERNFNGIELIEDFMGATGEELIGADLQGIRNVGWAMPTEHLEPEQ